MGRIALALAACIGLCSATASAQSTTAAPRSAIGHPAQMRIAGIALMAVGAGVFTTGVVLVGVGVSRNADASCTGSGGVVGCGSRSINGEMIGGWSAMGIGLIALGIGVPLYVIGRHRQQPLRSALRPEHPLTVIAW